MRVVLASDNDGKRRELEVLLAPLGIELVAQAALGIGAAEETAPTFVENALLKARHAARASGLAAIADDSGIAVDALAGAPGVRSARYAGEGASDAANLEKLVEALAGVPEERRTGRFVCALVYLRGADDPTPIVCEGRWEGTILERPRGDGGFGYDPIFLVPGTGRSSAQLSAAQKNALSHRGQAVRALVERLRETTR